jgi:hypothetical protein
MKKLVAVGMGYGAVPWLMSAGWARMWGTACGICGAIIVTSILMYSFGNAARRMTTEWSLLNCRYFVFVVEGCK